MFAEGQDVPDSMASWLQFGIIRTERENRTGG